MAFIYVSFAYNDWKEKDIRRVRALQQLLHHYIILKSNFIDLKKLLCIVQRIYFHNI